MSAIVLIPSRYASTRFPGKPLALLQGMPIIEHVYRNSLHSRLADDVVVTTDNKMIFEKVLSFGGKAVMTAESHVSGTDRIAEAAGKLDYDIIVNVQGDEPLIRPEMIDDVISILDDREASVGTLAKKISHDREICNPNTVKVVFDEKGYALYFSRAPIPYHRDLFSAKASPGASEEESRKNECLGAGNRDKLPLAGLSGPRASKLFMFKHVGIYSYRRDVLLQMTKLKSSRLEKIEKLEQLRALENGYKIKVKETFFETIGVDTPEDLERIEKCLNSSS